MTRNDWICDAHAHAGLYGCFHIPRAEPEGMIEAMDRCGVAMAICSHHLSIGPDAVLGNRLVAGAIDKYPDRFRGWITVNPHRPKEAEEELRRYDEHPGFVGVKLHPDLLEARVDSDGFRAAWEWCEDRRRPLLSHTWIDSQWSDLDMFVPLAGRYPHVPIILGHSGGTYNGHSKAIDLAREYPNFYLDITNSVRYHRHISRMVQGVSARRVLFGSDMPFLSLPSAVGAVLWSDITDEERTLVFGENARNLFGLKTEEN